MEKKKDRKKSKEKPMDYVEEGDPIGDEEMFMSVKDFEERQVVLPPFGRSKEEEDEDEVEDEEEEEESRFLSDKEVSDQERFCNRECYVFNVRHETGLNDKCCVHCMKYLTLQCPYINDFMDDVDELDVD